MQHHLAALLLASIAFVALALARPSSAVAQIGPMQDFASARAATPDVSPEPEEAQPLSPEDAHRMRLRGSFALFGGIALGAGGAVTAMLGLLALGFQGTCWAPSGCIVDSEPDRTGPMALMIGGGLGFLAGVGITLLGFSIRHRANVAIRNATLGLSPTVGDVGLNGGVLVISGRY